ncbi:MAG TPA: dockerin type I domain-containing protein [Pseudobacteroides sp.]|uniref:dockerin type I domain-containing protein n=1 Tax=Pseudobacteroides sp. TaxID=1968840 RepID=UPI002F95FD01
MKKCKISIIIGVMIMLQLAFTVIALSEGNTFILPELNLNKITGIVDVDFKYSSSYDSAIKSGFQVKLIGTELTASTDNRGYFEIYNVPKNAAEYTLNISKIGYLAREIKITDAQLSKQINIIEMWAGDLPDNILQDGIVNLKDIMSMAKSFNATYESPDYNEYKDFNKDKAINMVDILLIAKHFNSTSDSYPPIEDSAVNSIEVVNEYTIKVTFSKDMQSTPGVTSPKDGDASNKIYYTIKNNDEKIITISNATYSVADRTTTIILLGKQLGEYTIYINGIKDASGQEMKPEMNAIKFFDVTSPSVERVHYDNANKNKMLVVYNEEMATQGPFSVLLPENYKWDNDTSNGISYEALPIGSSIEVSPTDSNAVIITLGPGGETTSNAALQFGYITGTIIKALADKAGNIIINLGKAQTVELESPVTIINSDLAITSDNSLRVKVLGPKLLEVSADDFRYTLTDRAIDNFIPLSAKLVDVDNMQYIEFTVPQNTFSVYTDLSKVCIKTSIKPIGTKSALGTLITGNIVSPLASGTSFKTYIKSVSIYDWNSIVVKFEGRLMQQN